MSTLHTPGPWEQSNGVIFGSTATAIATVHKHQSPTVTLANARLIAAAPDLLEALKECLRHLERDDQHIDALGRWRPHYVKARDAIDKAEAA